MTLDGHVEREILEAYNCGRGPLPRATSVRARPNRRRLVSVSGEPERARLNVAYAVVQAGPEAWALLAPALSGNDAAFQRLVGLTREGLVDAARRHRARRATAGLARSARTLAPTPCQGTPHERRILESIVQWATETRGWSRFFPPDVQLRVSRRMTRDFGSYMARGGTFRITVSSRLFKAGLEDILLDTVLHELAHLLHAASNGRGRSNHGVSWKTWCHRLGARAERLAPIEDAERVRRGATGEPGGLPEPVSRWMAARGSDTPAPGGR